MHRLKVKVPGNNGSMSVCALAQFLFRDEMLLRRRAVDMVEDAGFTLLSHMPTMRLLASNTVSDIELLSRTSRCQQHGWAQLAYPSHSRWPSIRLSWYPVNCNWTDDDKLYSRFF